MDLSAVILHLRDHTPLFEGRVAGAAEYAKGVEDQTWMALPAAYLVPEDEDAEPDTAQSGGLEQEVTIRFGVVVALDNTADRRGQTASAQYHAVRMALFRALLNWMPPPPAGDVRRSAKGLYYVEGALQGFDRKRLFYKWTFALDTIITDADGWQETLPDLEAVTVTTKVPPDTDPVVAEFLTQP